MRIEAFYHHGIVVSDIKRSIEWYVRVLGLSVSRQPVEGSSDFLARVVGYPKARIILGMVGLPGQPDFSIELIQYLEPKGHAGPDRNDRCDVGAAHLGMLVDDVRSWYEKLKAEGVWVAGGPVLRDARFPMARYAFYFKDPDGHVLEMVERYPRPPGSPEN